MMLMKWFRYNFKMNSLKNHGAGPYYSLRIFRRIYISIGGHGWKRAWWKPHLTHYRYNATHMGIGPVTVSLCWCNMPWLLKYYRRFVAWKCNVKEQMNLRAVKKIGIENGDILQHKKTGELHKVLNIERYGVVTSSESGISDYPAKVFRVVEKFADRNVFVNVYFVTRHYGGPEEGGWWYNWYECEEAVPTTGKNADEAKETLEKKYEDDKRGDIYSVLGGVDVEVLIEDEPAQSESKEFPHYC